MLKYCVDKWYENREALKEAIVADKNIENCDYKYLVSLVVRHILHDWRYGWDFDNVIEIGDYDYSGEYVYVIKAENCDDACKVLLARVYYGSCSVCDTLLAAQSQETEQMVCDIMALCKDIVCSIVHPFKSYWNDDKVLDVIATVDNEEGGEC